MIERKKFIPHRCMDIIANQYADILLERLEKYYAVVFKNILFRSQKSITSKQIESCALWDAKFATRHHINFQTARLRELLDNSSGKKALAIGYLSFPVLLKMSDMFDEIYLLENTNECISYYKKWIEDNPEFFKKTKFIYFSSAIFEYITSTYKLYQSINLILIGTGSGSMIRKLHTYYLMCNTWLVPNGLIYISFLNDEFMYEYVESLNAEQNFEYIPIQCSNKAIASNSNIQEKYGLYCETYNSNKITDTVKRYFDLIRMYSYPLASVLEGPHKQGLQNILKELDKEYSRSGFTSKNYSNSKGYYIDGVLKKTYGHLLEQIIPEDMHLYKTDFDYLGEYKKRYIKVLLLVDKSIPCICNADIINYLELYVVLIPAYKTLPETDDCDIYLAPHKCRLLSISEINWLGIEYKNISPFLHSCSNIKLNKLYDMSLTHSNMDFFYIGCGKLNKGYKIDKNCLQDILSENNYRPMDIS